MGGGEAVPVATTEKLCVCARAREQTEADDTHRARSRKKETWVAGRVAVRGAETFHSANYHYDVESETTTRPFFVVCLLVGLLYFLNSLFWILRALAGLYVLSMTVTGHHLARCCVLIKPGSKPFRWVD